MAPSVRSDLMEFDEAVVLNPNKTLDSSEELLAACAKIENTSRMSDAPMFEPVARVVRFSSKALVIVLSDCAQYLLTAII